MLYTIVLTRKIDNLPMSMPEVDMEVCHYFEQPYSTTGYLWDWDAICWCLCADATFRQQIDYLKSCIGNQTQFSVTRKMARCLQVLQYLDENFTGIANQE